MPVFVFICKFFYSVGCGPVCPANIDTVAACKYFWSNRKFSLRERIIDGQKIDQILSELSELKQIINVHINQDKIEKEHLREEIGEMKHEIEELIRQKSNVRWKKAE